MNVVAICMNNPHSKPEAYCMTREIAISTLRITHNKIPNFNLEIEDQGSITKVTANTSNVFYIIPIFIMSHADHL